MRILVLNAGSSSHKFSFYALHNEEPLEPLWKGEIEWGRENQPLKMTVKTVKGIKIEKNLDSSVLNEGIKVLLESLWIGNTQVIEGAYAIERIGHRVVHGGSKFTEPTLIDEEVKAAIKKLIPLAPLHNPANLEGIELMESIFPSIPQIAVFDTSFHLTMPEIVKTYAVPWEWKEKGIQRYGFHGISHHYCAEKIPSFLGKNSDSLAIINCHLGNGCSLCAIKEGKSYETTMGFTPMEGLIMGTRCGSIDPGILLYLMREHKYKYEELDHVLNFKSGLKGIAGSSDMRELLEQSTEIKAALAVDMFVHHLKTFIGALVVSLEGLSVLNFTGGIGENSAVIRERVCQGLGCLGIAIDVEKNRLCQPDLEISVSPSSVRVLVLRTKEEWMIARACFNIKIN